MARFTNQAQLRYGNAIANSNIAVGEILEVLSATKTAVRKNYGRNDTITYLVSVVNAGNTAFTGLTLTDNLGAYVYDTQTLVPLRYIDGTVKYYSNGTLQAAPAVTAGPPLVISGLTVPANGSILIAYETDVNEYAPLDVEAEIVNTATIRGNRNNTGDGTGNGFRRQRADLNNYQVHKPGSGYGKRDTDVHVPDSEYRKCSCGRSGCIGCDGSVQSDSVESDSNL